MTGKLTIDKSSMNISYFLYTIKVIALKGGKVSRKNFVKEMAGFVGVPAVQSGKENRTAYNKSKLPRYFGFVDIVDNGKGTNELVLTHRGRILTEYIQDNGEDKESSERYGIAEEHRADFIDLIFDSIIFDSFGKNNSGAEQSNTDVEPPKVVFKTIYELGKATTEEICYVMFGLNRGLFTDFGEAIGKVKEKRSQGVYDYPAIMEEWGIANIVHDCKIINIFTDSNIPLLVYTRDGGSGRLYYQLSSVLSSYHKEQIRTIKAVYEPLKLFAYTKGNGETAGSWVNGAVLGRVSDNSQIIRYRFGVEKTHFCTRDRENFVPGAFEKAVLAAFQNEKKNIYLVVQNITEPLFFQTIGRYAALLNRVDNVADAWHGWSKTPLKDKGFYQWLAVQCGRARTILHSNEVILPSNLHIVGTVIMNNENKDTKFDYEFRRCLIHTGEEGVPEELSIEESKRIQGGANVLLYGVPGSGKSWTIEHEYCKKGANVERLTFHPDYTYSDFIGQILPDVSEDGQVSYRFTPGPFTNILKEAYHHPEEAYILIIEEINRGNAPAIFGAVFQLLDRKMEAWDRDDDGFPIGTSEYGITNANIARIVYKNEKQKVRIPSNLTIIGTMNTSDQNVFTLDTAFQRRWEMHLVENSFEQVDRKLADALILDTGITWEVFCTQINKIIVGNNVGMALAEDKRLGVYFVHWKDLQFDHNMGNLADGEYDGLCGEERNGTIDENGRRRLSSIRDAMKQNRRFPEKVLKYLWDDAFKFDREMVFETATYQSLEEVIRAFMYAEKKERFAMFKDNVRNAFMNPER